MVFSLSGSRIHAPVGVVPAVSLRQLKIARIEQLLEQIGILPKLCPNDLFHDAVLHGFPVRAQLNLLFFALGYHAVQGTEPVPHGRIEGLG